MSYCPRYVALHEWPSKREGSRSFSAITGFLAMRAVRCSWRPLLDLMSLPPHPHPPY